MRQQVRIVCEDGNELEINFNCDEDLKPRERITFRLHPPSPTNASTGQPEKNEDAEEISLPATDEPVEFMVRFWRYRGYLIIQYGENDFSFYAPNGTYCENSTSMDAACTGIDNHIANLNLIQSTKPRSRP